MLKTWLRHGKGCRSDADSPRWENNVRAERLGPNPEPGEKLPLAPSPWDGNRMLETAPGLHQEAQTPPRRGPLTGTGLPPPLSPYCPKSLAKPGSSPNPECKSSGTVGFFGFILH